MTTGPRLLLVELLPQNSLKESRGDLFPLLQGLVRSRGVEVRWVAVQAPAGSRGGHPVELADTVRGRLRAEVEAFRPTLLLSSERLDSDLGAELRDVAESVQVTSVAAEEPFWLDRVLGAAGGRLAAPGSSDYHNLAILTDEALADFECRVLDSDAGATLSTAAILGAPTCAYRRPLASNPAFHGVDLRAVLNARACAFCLGGWRDHAPRPRRDPVDLAFRQITRYLETASPERRTWRFNMRDPRVFLKV